jgi:hypothetical protein
LTNIDELNLNAIVMIGAGCPLLERLKISYCHYTVEANDRRRLEAAAAEAAATRTETATPFRMLRYATFLLSRDVNNQSIKRFVLVLVLIRVDTKVDFLTDSSSLFYEQVGKHQDT